MLLNFSLVENNVDIISQYLIDHDNRSHIYINKNNGMMKIFSADAEGLSERDICEWEIIQINNESGKLSLESKLISGINTVAKKILKKTINLLDQRLNPVSTILPFVGEMQKESDLILIEEVLKDARVCFGDQILELLSNHSGCLKTLAGKIFVLAAQRLASPLPIDEIEIEKIYRLLFKTPLSQFSFAQQDSYHPAKVFQLLMDGILGMQEMGNRAKVPTGGDGGFLGVNGSYFITGVTTEKLWIFKPGDEEKEEAAEGIPVGESAKREHIACLLNHQRAYPIPYTAYIMLRGQAGSAQLFEKNCKGLSVLNLDQNAVPYIAKLPKGPIQASLAFDIRFGNSDRHLGNLLCKGVMEGGLFVPTDSLLIDHGLCMSSSSEDPLKLEQITLPQMLEDWDNEVITSLLNSNVHLDRQIMEEHGIPENAIVRMERATIFLQHAHEISQSSQEGISINPYDLGLIALKNSTAFWNDEEFSKVMKLLETIIPSKKIIRDLKPNFSRAKLIIERKKFAAAHGDLNNVQISCLFGAAHNDGAPERIDWNASILGKFFEGLNQ